MATTFDRGASFGGDDGFEILMGGQIRYTFPVDTDSNTDVWERGFVLRVDSSGNLELDDASGSTNMRGLAIERRSPVGGRPEEDEVQGSGKASILMDPAIIRTVQFVSGIAIAINDKLYPDGSTGKLTNVDAGSQPVMGKALTASTGAVDGDTTSIVVYYDGTAPVAE